MQALCQWDVQHDESPEALGEFMIAQEATESAGEYATELVTTFWTRRKEVDRQVSKATRRWDLARISPAERNIMRVAVVELLSGSVPPKVALDEAIEIGREYGGADSPRFINGVLDEVLGKLEGRQKGDG